MCPAARPPECSPAKSVRAWCTLLSKRSRKIVAPCGAPSWPDVGPNLVEVSPSLVEVGATLSIPGQFLPMRAKSCRHRPDSTSCWSIPGELGPESAKLGPIRPFWGRCRPTIARTRSTLHRIRPNICHVARRPSAPASRVHCWRDTLWWSTVAAVGEAEGRRAVPQRHPSQNWTRSPVGVGGPGGGFYRSGPRRLGGVGGRLASLLCREVGPGCTAQGSFQVAPPMGIARRRR